MRYLLLLCFPLLLISADLKVQVLGSGGPELDERASASYVVWIDGKARVLVDFGGGAFVRLGEAKAKIDDIDYILFTHFHIDHVVDFAALAKASYFSDEHKTIKVFGPSGSPDFPDTKRFLKGQFNNSSVYGYMSDILDTQSKYISFKPYIFSKSTKETSTHIIDKDLTIDLIAVRHGNVPALAYKITVDDKIIVFSGDTAATTDNLIKLAQNADLFIAHHAILEHAQGMARELHMIPSRIGEIAHKAKVRKLLLAHRMQRTLGREKESISLIRRSFQGKILLAEDLLIIPLTK